MPFSLSLANHELFWSLINNVYSIRKSHDVGYRNFAPLEFSDHWEYWINSRSVLASCLHSHSLDESDANKRNSFLRKIAGAEVAKGYHPASVIGSLRGAGRSEARALLAAAGGTLLLAALQTRDLRLRGPRRN
ncbi:unnamed protein product [Sphagnum balticum]